MSRSTKTKRDRYWSGFDPEQPESDSPPYLLNLKSPTRRDAFLSSCYVFLIALAARITFVIYDGGMGYEPKADSQDFHMIAVSLANGTGYSRLFPDFTWHPTAYRMPLTPLVVAGIYKSFGVRPFVARVIFAVIGALACALLVGIATSAVGRRQGVRAGTIAGLFAALDPFMVMNQTLVLLEPLHTFLVACLVFFALSYARTPKGSKLGAMAAVAALLSLNRPDGFFYALLAAILAALCPLFKGKDVFALAHKAGGQSGSTGPRALLESAESVKSCHFIRSRESGYTESSRAIKGLRSTPLLKRRLASSFVVVGAVVLALAPWTIRNYKAFETFIPLTTASGDLFLGANNQATYASGPFYGYWAYGALTTGEAAAYGFAGEVRADRERRRLALEYAIRHPSKAITVVPIRILRGWDLFDPLGNARFGTAWGRPESLSLLALGLYYPGLALAAWSAFALRRRWKELFILYALPIYLTVLFAVTTGEPRYRAGTQLVIWIFSGISLAKYTDKL